jgi:hypothetical protein
MSNTFNSNENKQKILDIIKGTIQPSIGTVESSFPDDYDYPQKLKEIPKSTTIANLLKTYRINTFKTRTINDLVEVSSLDFLPDYLVPYAEENEGLKDTVNLPIAETQFIPRYVPVYRAYKYDHGLYHQILYHTITAPEHIFRHNKYFTAEIDAAIRHNVYCSGSLQGQLSRLNDMNKIRYAVSTGGRSLRKGAADFYKARHKAAVDDFKKTGIPASYMGFNWMETGCNIYKKYFPIYSVAAVDNWPGLFTGIFGFIKPSEQITDEDEMPLNDENGNPIMTMPIDFLPAISGDKSFGPPYQAIGKKQYLTEALILAEAFYGELLIAMSDNTGAQHYVDKLTGLLDRYWYLSAGWYFPKAEVYERDKIDTKTRNIWSMSFVTHMLYSLILDTPKRYTPNCLIDPNVHNLYKFCPFYGGIHRFVELLMSLEESSCYIYADNIYMLIVNQDGTKEFYSLDLTKAESQVQPEDAMFVNYYFLTRGHTLPTGDAAFNSLWATIALYLIPNFVVDSTGILSNVQFKVPGQGSGNTGTFDNNHAKSAQFVIAWETRGKPSPQSNGWANVAAMSGVDLKIEHQDLDFGASVQRAMDNPPQGGYVARDGLSEPPMSPGIMLKMDCLGYGAVWSTELEQFVPVLDDERLAKSLCLCKKQGKVVEGDDMATMVNNQLYKLARSLGMMMLGGWRYAPVANSLEQFITESKVALTRVKAKLEQVEETFKTLEIAQLLEEVKFNKEFTVDREFLLSLFADQPDRYTRVSGKQYSDIKKFTVKLDRFLTMEEEMTFTPNDLLKSNLKLDFFTRLELYEALKVMKDSTEGKTDPMVFFNNQKVKDALTSLKTIKDLINVKLTNVEVVQGMLAIKEKDIEAVIDPYVYYHLPIRIAKNFKLGKMKPRHNRVETEQQKDALIKKNKKIMTKAVDKIPEPNTVKLTTEINIVKPDFIVVDATKKENRTYKVRQTQEPGYVPRLTGKSKVYKEPNALDLMDSEGITLEEATARIQKLKIQEEEYKALEALHGYIDDREIERVKQVTSSMSRKEKKELKAMQEEYKKAEPKFDREAYIDSFPQPVYMPYQTFEDQNYEPEQAMKQLISQSNLLFYAKNPENFIKLIKNLAKLYGLLIEDFYEYPGMPTTQDLELRYKAYVY